MTTTITTRRNDGSLHFMELVASAAPAIPVKPPKEWFDAPQLDKATALTVEPSGRVYGHAAAWGVRHIGLAGSTTAPRSRSGYKYYLTGQVETDDGSMVATGRITMGGGHADLHGNITAASEHYDNVCAAVADVVTGEDEYGIWFAGALRPEVTPEQIRTLRASSVSGDWRGVDNGLELCGILAVNVPGFSMPRAEALAASGAEVTSLVAAGVVTRENPNPQTPEHEETPVEIKKGDLVEIVASGALAQVTDRTDDGYAVELLVSGEEIKPASEEKALAASAAQQTRAQLRSLTATVEQLQAKLDAQDRAEAAARLLADIEV
jgi:hypothetical protein